MVAWKQLEQVHIHGITGLQPFCTICRKAAQITPVDRAGCRSHRPVTTSCSTAASASSNGHEGKAWRASTRSQAGY